MRLRRVAAVSLSILSDRDIGKIDEPHEGLRRGQAVVRAYEQVCPERPCRLSEDATYEAPKFNKIDDADMARTAQAVPQNERRDRPQVVLHEPLQSGDR